MFSRFAGVQNPNGCTFLGRWFVCRTIMIRLVALYILCNSFLFPLEWNLTSKFTKHTTAVSVIGSNAKLWGKQMSLVRILFLVACQVEPLRRSRHILLEHASIQNIIIILHVRRLLFAQPARCRDERFMNVRHTNSTETVRNAPRLQYYN